MKLTNPSDDAGDYEKSWNNNQNVDTIISVEFDEALEETTRRAHRHHQTQTTNNLYERKENGQNVKVTTLSRSR